VELSSQHRRLRVGMAFDHRFRAALHCCRASWPLKYLEVQHSATSKRTNIEVLYPT
jgi:hypothetical protein